MESDSEKKGIDLEKCDKQRMRAACQTAKLVIPAKAEAVVLAELLTAHYTKQRAQGVDMAICDKCNGVGPAAHPRCPFCGELNSPPESSAIGGGSESEADSSMALATVEEKGHIVPAGQSVFTRPVVAAGRPPAKATEGELEVEVGNLQRFKRTFSENSWDIGNSLNRIAAETPDRPALWKLRMEEDGKTPAYQNFKGFLRAETGISWRMAQGLMAVASKYRREDVALTGTAKLEVVLNAPPSERKRLLATAQTTPLKKLRAHVKELNIAAGRGEAQRKGKETLAANRAAAGKTTAEKPVKAAPGTGLTTLVLPRPKGSIWLYRRNKDNEGKNIRATQLSDNYGWIDAQNGVQLMLTVEKLPDNKGLKVHYEAKRVEV